MAFEIKTVTEIPAATRTFKGEAKYPFDELNVFPADGNSFFVADSEAASKDAKKTMQSAVSAAHEKYAVVDPSGAMRTIERGENKGKEVPATVRTRTFIVRAHVEDGVPGAMVTRTK